LNSQLGHRIINTRQQTRIVSVVSVVLLGMILSACVITKTDLGAMDVKPETDQTAPQGGLFTGIDGISCIPDLSTYETATLVEVVDGDSIKVIVNGEQTQVRYIGINTPEYDSPQRDEALEARGANHMLLAGGTLYLFKDVSDTDQYDRLLRYVVANGQFVNRELVRAGFAESKAYKPDTSCQAAFDSVESAP